MRILKLLPLLLAMAACGQKGPLYLQAETAAAGQSAESTALERVEPVTPAAEEQDREADRAEQ